jgi:DNA-binding LytR/AlgR family response regulator
MNILIVEDEMVVAADLESMLADYGFTENIIATNYTEAVTILESMPVYIALLDINLGGYKTGIDVAKYINSKMSMPVIFLTAYEDIATVNAALATAPHAYLQKPFGSASLYAALQLALSNYKKAQHKDSEQEDDLIIRDAIFVKDRNGYTRVALQDICYIRSDGNYMALHTDKRKFLIRIPQKVLLEQLPPTFIKTHKSYIVNGSAVTAVGETDISLGELSIPLSPAYKNELLDKLKIL